jgi:type I restriction enzyme S subunit
MNKIEQIIDEFCQNGVEYKTLSELGYFYGGLTGKNKNDFSDGNARFITYMNIFSNIAINTNITDFVKVGESENQNEVELGDVLFTGSSETPEECGISSVLTKQVDEPLYLNSFCFGFRLNDKTMFLSDFLKYLFREDNLRKQIIQTASGVTRFNVSKKRMEKVLIPIPPLPIQQEIVNILDKFTALEAELEAELEARKKQYEYYRNELVVSGKWLMVSLGESCHYSNTRIDAEKLNEENYVGVDNLLQNKQGKTNSSYIPEKGKLCEFKKDDILIGNIRPYLKKIWKSGIIGGTNGDVLVIRINDDYKEKLIAGFLYYLLASDNFFNYDTQYSKGTKMPRGDKSAVMKYKIPLPPLVEQNRIVSILDKFDKLVNDMSEGLPAEIKMRRQQYEYYRNKLLMFDCRDVACNVSTGKSSKNTQT